MAIQIGRISDRLEFQLGSRSYTTTTSFTEGESKLLIKADNGASCDIRQTSTSLTLKGNDETGKKFSLTLTEVGENLRATAQIGTRRWRITTSPDKALSRLGARIMSTPGIKDQLPQGEALAPLAKEVRNNPRLFDHITGGSRLAATVQAKKRKTYCESVCDCCTKATWLSAWCCISCASCDIFDVDFHQRGQLVFKSVNL